uniref:GUN4-like domain-containing protein n=1 Tax=Lophosiphonia teges TaxID=2007110 RepID=A0A1Z1MVN4_9FLOR|nr:hypothetical protein [Polysiphonia teges]
MEQKINKLRNISKEIDNIFKQDYSIIPYKIEKLIDEILYDDEGEKLLLEIIIERVNNLSNDPDIVDGLIYQKILEKSKSSIKENLIVNLPNGVIHLDSLGIFNYQPLQNLLIKKQFQEADKLTQQYLCRLVEIKTNNKKNWLYFTDVQFVPQQDLFMLDMLWRVYSKGKFGFSIQKKVWVHSNKKWDKLWEKIHWINNGIMKRYPDEFVWTTDAPEGHLPLFNQLRGTQALHYLFKSIKW